MGGGQVVDERVKAYAAIESTIADGLNALDEISLKLEQCDAKTLYDAAELAWMLANFEMHNPYARKLFSVSARAFSKLAGKKIDTSKPITLERIQSSIAGLRKK